MTPGHCWSNSPQLSLTSTVFDVIYNSPRLELILPRYDQGAGLIAKGSARVPGNINRASSLPPPVQELQVPLTLVCEFRDRAGGRLDGAGIMGRADAFVA